MKKNNNFKKIIINFWQGKIYLSFSFWVVLTIGGTIVSLPAYLITDSVIDNFSELSALLFLLAIIFQYIYMIFAYVGTWRSASNYKPKKKQWAWGAIAQVYMTLSIIRTIVEIIKSLNI
jgi:hypothetical protein